MYLHSNTAIFSVSIRQNSKGIYIYISLDESSTGVGSLFFLTLGSLEFGSDKFLTIDTLGRKFTPQISKGYVLDLPARIPVVATEGLGWDFLLKI